MSYLLIDLQATIFHMQQAGEPHHILQTISTDGHALRHTLHHINNNSGISATKIGIQPSSHTTENVLLVSIKFHDLILVRTNLVYSSGNGISCLLNFVLCAFSSVLVALLYLFLVYCRLVLQLFALGAGSLS